MLNTMYIDFSEMTEIEYDLQYMETFIFLVTNNK